MAMLLSDDVSRFLPAVTHPATQGVDEVDDPLHQFPFRVQSVEKPLPQPQLCRSALLRKKRPAGSPLMTWLSSHPRRPPREGSLL